MKSSFASVRRITRLVNDRDDSALRKWKVIAGARVASAECKQRDPLCRLEPADLFKHITKQRDTE